MKKRNVGLQIDGFYVCACVLLKKFIFYFDLKIHLQNALY